MGERAQGIYYISEVESVPIYARFGGQGHQTCGCSRTCPKPKVIFSLVLTFLSLMLLVVGRRNLHHDSYVLYICRIAPMDL